MTRIRLRSEADTPAVNKELKQAENSKYAVGYRKPPPDSQFKPGQSGNPRGRPKTSDRIEKAIKNVLKMKVTLRDEYGTRQVSYLEALYQKQMVEGLKGKVRSAEFAMKYAIMMLAEKPSAQFGGELKGTTPQQDEETIRELFLMMGLDFPGAASLEESASHD